MHLKKLSIRNCSRVGVCCRIGITSHMRICRRVGICSRIGICCWIIICSCIRICSCVGVRILIPRVISLQCYSLDVTHVNTLLQLAVQAVCHNHEVNVQCWKRIYVIEMRYLYFNLCLPECERKKIVRKPKPRV